MPKIPNPDFHTLASVLPPLYAQEHLSWQACVGLKIFDPCGAWTWYLTEYDPAKRIAFGLVHGFEMELGYIDIDELEQYRGSLGLPLEQDLYFEPRTLAQCRQIHEPDWTPPMPRTENAPTYRIVYYPAGYAPYNQLVHNLTWAQVCEVLRQHEGDEHDTFTVPTYLPDEPASYSFSLPAERVYQHGAFAGCTFIQAEDDSPIPKHPEYFPGRALGFEQAGIVAGAQCVYTGLNRLWELDYDYSVILGRGEPLTAVYTYGKTVLAVSPDVRNLLWKLNVSELRVK